MLRNSLQNYDNRSIEVLKVIENFVQMSNEINQEKRGNDLSLSTEEVASLWCISFI
ncbi:type I restriction enzyme endonuclease domain-containing protein [Staphylococcus epidermidis]|uniref:type I restriction enzyme endonuclease domain-containing protein n=1 Tax=Staphylococcus epidermidis TaxID=1282 RepID=UPI003399A95D